MAFRETIVLGALLVGGQLFAAPSMQGCRQILGAEKILKPGALVMLGEMHGTQEAPQFTGDLVCAALSKGFHVNLALEISIEEDARITQYLHSSGLDPDKRALLAGPFWTDTYQDGRRSAAVLDLIDRARSLTMAKKPLRVVLLDSGGGDRDQGMATRLRQTAGAEPKAITISLTGNFHNRINPESSNAPAPMGSYIADLHPVALNEAYAQGSAWFCTGDGASCGAQSLSAAKVVSGLPAWSLDTKMPTADRYWIQWNGVFRVGNPNASPPAVSTLNSTDELHKG